MNGWPMSSPSVAPDILTFMSAPYLGVCSTPRAMPCSSFREDLGMPMVSTALTRMAGDARQSLRQTLRGRRDWVDRFLGSDPGLNRFRGALHCILTIAAALEAEWLFVHFTGALQANVVPGSP